MPERFDQLDKDAIISNVVKDFYALATTDFMIGYHFRKIATSEGHDPLKPPLEAFAHHLPRIEAFWKMLLLGERLPDNFTPFHLIPVHKQLSIRFGELGRWVTLFKKVLVDYERVYPEQADLFWEWWHQIRSFQEKFQHSTVLFPKGSES